MPIRHSLAERLLKASLLAAEASEQILAHIQRMSPEYIQLEQATGYVLYDDLFATTIHPPWRNSSMDGYAIRGSDLARVPTALRVVECVAAGQFPSRDVAVGESTQIMTGAPLPDSADTVIRIEDTDRGTDFVTVNDDRDRYKNVRPSGEDFRAGDRLMRAGDEVTAAALGVLASAGIERVKVYRRPTVAIVSSGDELVLLNEFSTVRTGRRIVSSNSYTLPALIRDAGGIPHDYGIAADTTDSLGAKVASARECDIIITSAGISVGEHDYTRQVLQAFDADIKFWKVRIRPGAPLAFGILGATPWIGMSGNPVSAMVTFELFVRPAIRKMCGHDALFPATLTVTLDEPVTTAVPLTHFLRAVITPGDAGYRARLTGTQSSSALTSMLRANALIVLPYDRQEYSEGDTVTAIPLGGSLYHTSCFPE